MGKPDRSSFLNLVSNLSEIGNCYDLCAFSKLEVSAPGVSFCLGHTVDSSRFRWKVFTNTKIILRRCNVNSLCIICNAMSTPLCLQIAYRPSAALQQLALHNHLEETMLGQCPCSNIFTFVVFLSRLQQWALNVREVIKDSCLTSPPPMPWP